MRDYSPGHWGVGFIWSLEGSVFPRAMCCALPNALLAVGVWYICNKMGDEKILEDAKSGLTVGQVWTGYNWVLGFTVAFRTQRAYARWWEGGTLLQQARGEWFNAYSSLIAFCSPAHDKMLAVEKFQQVLARLVSMLYASALMSIATETDIDFEILDASGIDKNSLKYLRSQPDKCEIIMQWIQRLIVDNMGIGAVSVPPPVISRVFQELSRGIVNIHNCRKITEFQFPFPAAQMIVTMLMIQWALTPVVTALLVGSPVWAFGLSFFPIFACWGINYLAGELEQPFGTDYNDMPMEFMQASMNTSILALLDVEAQNPPEFDMEQNRLQAFIPNPRKSKGAQEDTLDPMRSVVHVTVAEPEQLNAMKHRFTRGRDVLARNRASNRRGVDNFEKLRKSNAGSVDTKSWRTSSASSDTEADRRSFMRMSNQDSFQILRPGSMESLEEVEHDKATPNAMLGSVTASSANHPRWRTHENDASTTISEMSVRRIKSNASHMDSGHKIVQRSNHLLRGPNDGHLHTVPPSHRGNLDQAWNKPENVCPDQTEEIVNQTEDDLQQIKRGVLRQSANSASGEGVRCPERAPDMTSTPTAHDAEFHHPGTPLTSEPRPNAVAPPERPSPVW